jgi:predicted transcriptional regulator
MVEYKLFLPEYLLFIYTLGQKDKYYNSDLVYKTRTSASTINAIRNKLFKLGIIEYTETVNKREKPFRLTKKGMELYNAVLVIIKSLNIKGGKRNENKRNL